ncbi:MAG: hypothetical protein H6735_26435 [Alphaproteobacteria bacterium]|nr:hypothetical protein [Alphaproteobacteria bacterium]
MNPLLLALFAHASDTLPSAAQVAMGRTGIASETENTALSLNPGLLGLTDRYDVEGMFRYGPDNGLGWGASVVDARTSDQLAGGLFYSGDSYSPPLTIDDSPGWTIPGEEIPNRRRFHDFGLGVAFPLADRKLSLGLGALLGYYNHDRIGDGWRFDASAGVGWKPLDTLTLGLMGRGLVPWGEQDVEASTGLGVRFHPRKFVIEGNAAWLPETTDAVPLLVAAGVEQGFGPARLRAGWNLDAPTETNALSLGLGLTGQGATLEYAAWIPVTGTTGIDATQHVLSVRLAAPAEIEEP